MKLPAAIFCIWPRALPATSRLADRDDANLRPDRLMVGYAADTDRYTCTER